MAGAERSGRSSSECYLYSMLRVEDTRAGTVAEQLARVVRELEQASVTGMAIITDHATTLGAALDGREGSLQALLRRPIIHVRCFVHGIFLVVGDLRGSSEEWRLFYQDLQALTAFLYKRVPRTFMQTRGVNACIGPFQENKWGSLQAQYEFITRYLPVIQEVLPGGWNRDPGASQAEKDLVAGAKKLNLRLVPNHLDEAFLARLEVFGSVSSFLVRIEGDDIVMPDAFRMWCEYRNRVVENGGR
jgi:hypothetical protein